MTLPIPHTTSALPAALEPEPVDSGPAGLNQRHEDFCLSFVRYGNAAAAARAAGYASVTSHNQGYRLLKRTDIRVRIGEIRQAMGGDGCADRDVLLGKLENVYNRALEDHHFTAAARTVEIQARLAGLMPSLRERPLAVLPAPSAQLTAADDDN